MTPEDDTPAPEKCLCPNCAEAQEELFMEIGALQDEVKQLRAEMDHKDASGLSLYIATLEERQKALDFFIKDVEDTLQTRILRLEEKQKEDKRYYDKMIMWHESTLAELVDLIPEEVKKFKKTPGVRKKKKGGKA